MTIHLAKASWIEPPGLNDTDIYKDITQILFTSHLCRLIDWQNQYFYVKQIKLLIVCLNLESVIKAWETYVPRSFSTQHCSSTGLSTKRACGNCSFFLVLRYRAASRASEPACQVINMFGFMGFSYKMYQNCV